jgi:hypothetical protein
MNDGIQDLPQAGIFARIFENMESSSSSDSLNVSNTLFHFNERPIYAARDSLGNPHLLISVSDADEVLSTVIAKGLRTGLKHFDPTEQDLPSTFFDLFCVVAESDGVFGAICNDFCTSIDQKNSEKVDLRAVLDAVIAKWLSILQMISEDSPSPNQISGLIGELWMLESAVASFGPNAIQFWFGPERSRHDFETQGLAVEVKTSTILTKKRIQIHGIGQLDVAMDTKLRVVLYQVERSAGSDSVSKVCGRLISAGVDPQVLNAKLNQFGENLTTSTEPWTRRFEIKPIATSVFEVDADFPKLQKQDLVEMLQSRIGNVSYSLDLDGIACQESLGNNIDTTAGILFR